MTAPVWSEAKRAFLRFERNVVVSAGAGSGKTTALVELYLRLLGGDPPEADGPGRLGEGGRPLEPEEIVLMTFTERAAQDLTRKIRRGVARRLAAAQAAPDGSPARRAAARWSALREAFEAAPVGTIHGVAARLLREHPVEAGVDPGFEVLDEPQAVLLRAEAVADVLREALAADDPVVARLLAHVPLADRGEYQPGLETTLARRHAALRGHGTSLDDLAAATARHLDAFTAWRADLAARLAAAAEAVRGIAAAGPFLEAWDALPPAARALEPPLDDGTWARLVALLPLGKGWKGPGARSPARKALADALDAPLLLARWQEVGTPLGEACLDLLARVDRRYEAAKVRRHALDFDDLEVRVLALLRRDAAAGGTLLVARPRVVLVDEFQDNNRRQLEIVKRLAADAEGRPRPRSLAVVGDPKQSIYRFRGADVGVFAEVRRWVQGDRPPLRFTENFRSVGEILEFVNEVCARDMGPPMPERPDFEVPFGPEDRLSLPEGALDRHAGAPVVEVLVLSPGERGELGARREMEAVVRRVAGLLAEGVRPGDVAVLMRRLARASVVRDGLEAAGIPVYVVGGGGFYDAPEVRDVAALLASLETPFDPVALTAVLRSPFAGLSDDALLLLARPARGCVRPLPEAFEAGRLRPPVPELPEGDRARLEVFAAWHAALAARKDRTPMPELIEEALERSGYLAAVLTRSGGDQQVGNLRKLLEWVRGFESGAGRTLRDLVREIGRLVAEGAREAAAQVVSADDDVVRIMTIHQAKGLEFPVVVLPGCGRGPFTDTGQVRLDEHPATGALAVRPVDPVGLETQDTWLARRVYEAASAREVAESRRLFYVAATRAARRLVLVGEHPVNANGEPREGTSWRRAVDACLAAVTALEGRAVVRRPWSDLAPPGPAAPPAPAARAGDPAPVLARLRWRPPAPTRFTLGTTDLAEFATCPRRFYLTRRLGLGEAEAPWFDGADRRPDDDLRLPGDDGEGGAPPLAARDRGTLAHEVLERAPLGLDPDQLADAVRVLVRLRSAEVAGGVSEADQANVAERVLRFLHGPTGTDLVRAHRADGGRVRREHPFVVRLAADGAVLDVRGTIDVLFTGADGRLTLLDYKTTRRLEAALAGPYAIQVRTYALAAARLEGRPVGRAGLVFLDDRSPEPAWIDAGAEVQARLEADAVAHARRIAALDERDGADGWATIPEARCRALGCGFVARCHPSRRAGTGTAGAFAGDVH